MPFCHIHVGLPITSGLCQGVISDACSEAGRASSSPSDLQEKTCILRVSTALVSMFLHPWGDNAQHSCYCTALRFVASKPCAVFWTHSISGLGRNVQGTLNQLPVKSPDSNVRQVATGSLRQPSHLGLPTGRGVLHTLCFPPRGAHGLVVWVVHAEHAPDTCVRIADRSLAHEADAGSERATVCRLDAVVHRTGLDCEPLVTALATVGDDWSAQVAARACAEIHIVGIAGSKFLHSAVGVYTCLLYTSDAADE